ncbi:conserved exported hypothetical protein [Candidatus Terasakiella magnetica]|nr:conserved exported hypothetical protein [Candidatus Terasakiella magnetica]
MRSLLILGVCFVLAGCGTTVSTWQKSGATKEEEQTIVKRCEYEAEANSQDGITSDSMRRERVRKLRDMCFEANGMILVKREYVPAN